MNFSGTKYHALYLDLSSLEDTQYQHQWARAAFFLRRGREVRGYKLRIGSPSYHRFLRILSKFK